MKALMNAGQLGDSPIGYNPPSIKQTLTDRRDSLLAELSKVEAALAVFEKTPEIAEALELITKAVR